MGYLAGLIRAAIGQRQSIVCIHAYCGCRSVADDAVTVEAKHIAACRFPRIGNDHIVLKIIMTVICIYLVKACYAYPFGISIVDMCFLHRSIKGADAVSVRFIGPFDQFEIAAAFYKLIIVAIGRKHGGIRRTAYHRLLRSARDLYTGFFADINGSKSRCGGNIRISAVYVVLYYGVALYRGCSACRIQSAAAAVLAVLDLVAGNNGIFKEELAVVIDTAAAIAFTCYLVAGYRRIVNDDISAVIDTAAVFGGLVALYGAAQYAAVFIGGHIYSAAGPGTVCVAGSGAAYYAAVHSELSIESRNINAAACVAALLSRYGITLYCAAVKCEQTFIIHTAAAVPGRILRNGAAHDPEIAVDNRAVRSGVVH